MQKAGNELLKAKQYSFLLLKFRQRSEKELHERLAKKKFDAEIINHTVDFLKGKKFLNDIEFTKAWLAWRLKKAYGLKRIEQELLLKGVDKKIIRDCFAELKENYREDRVVAELAQKQFSKLKNIEPQKAKNRVYGYLLRRGFAADVVLDVLNSLEIASSQ